MRIISLLLSSLIVASACRSAPPATTRPPAATGLAVDGTYKSGGDCANGSPENPTCIQTLELSAGGRGSFIGDDIVEAATWTQDGNTVRVSVAGRTMELQVKPDRTLVDDNGTVWTREPERMR